MKLFKLVKIYRVLMANSFSYEAQYRHDTWIKLITNLLWIGMMFIIIEVVFSQTKALAGWSKEAVYLITVFWIMTDEFWVMFFGSNLPNISDTIVSGNLDFYLTKPAPPLFLVSLKIFLTRGLYRLLTQAAIAGWLIWNFQINFSSGQFLLVVLLLFAAVVIIYALSLIANTLSFWFLRIENINEVVWALRGLGRFPLEIWPKTLKIIFLTSLPIAFGGYVPAAFLIGNWPWYGALYAFLLAAFLFWIAVKFWNFALRRYSSASS